jgi:hypothetical protein
MSYLFKIEDKIVQPTEEVLLISPFKEIWERDKSKGKEIALKEFAFIEFTVSLLASNPYKGYSESIRDSIVQQDIFKDIEWKPDKLIEEGKKKFESFQKDGSQSYTLYKSAVAAKDKLVNFLNEIDINERNFKTGMPIYKPKELTSALLDVDKVIASLDVLKKKVEEELFESTKVKGQKEISIFAKLESLNS